MTSPQRNRAEVVATALDDAGAGLATDATLGTIHVTDLLPGERAEVAVDHHSPHKREAWAHIVRRVGGLSEDRTFPPCAAFGRCGGCTWQHLGYAAQLREKHARVVAALGDAAPGVTVAAVRPSPQELGYRNKGKYVAGRTGERLVLGAYAPRTHVVIDTLGCAIVAPIIDEVAAWLRGAAADAGLEPYAEATRTGELRYAIVREAAGDVLVVLVTATRTARDKLQRVADALAKHPAVRGVVAIEHDRRDGAIVPSGSSARVLHGHGSVVEHLAGVPIEVGAAEFLQVNRAQAAAMYQRVTELAALAPGARAVDLFAGLGGIGLSLARAGASVIAVEIDQDAVGQLRRAAERAKLPVVPIAGDARELPAEIRARLGDRPDLVVVNPPRKGLDAGSRELVVALDAPIVIYVSCGPESLGRDIAALAAHGYRVDAIEPFDLMPGTAQVETIVRLSKPAR